MALALRPVRSSNTPPLRANALDIVWIGCMLTL